MLFATFLGVLLIPVFYVVVRRLLGDKLDGETSRHAARPSATACRRSIRIRVAARDPLTNAGDALDRIGMTRRSSVESRDTQEHRPQAANSAVSLPAPPPRALAGG